MFNRFETRSLLALVFLYATRMLGLFMVLPVLALFAPQYAGSTTFWVGVALGVYGLTQGLLQIPFGLLSDRLGRKPILMAGMLLFILGSMIAALADSMFWMIVGRALQGTGAVSSVIMALLSDLTREQNRTKAMAAVGGSIGASFAIAMVLGPVVASIWGLSAIFWITAGLGLVGIAVVAGLPNPQSQVSGQAVIPVPRMIGDVLGDRELTRLNFGIFVLHFAQMATWVAVPVVLEQVVGFPRSQHWWLYLATMGGGFALMVPFLWYGETRRKMKPVFVGAVAVLTAAEVVLLMGGSTLAQIFAGLLLFFMAFNLLEASLPSLLSKQSPAGVKGTAMGVYSSCQFFGAFCGGLAGGAVAHYFGLQAVFVLSLLGAAVWLLVASRMAVPRHLSSMTLAMKNGESLDSSQFVGVVAGVRDVINIPEQKLIYVKVDEQRFDRAHFEAVLGRPLASN